MHPQTLMDVVNATSTMSSEIVPSIEVHVTQLAPAVKGRPLMNAMNVCQMRCEMMKVCALVRRIGQVITVGFISVHVIPNEICVMVQLRLSAINVLETQFDPRLETACVILLGLVTTVAFSPEVATSAARQAVQDQPTQTVISVLITHI